MDFDKVGGDGAYLLVGMDNQRMNAKVEELLQEADHAQKTRHSGFFCNTTLTTIVQYIQELCTYTVYIKYTQQLYIYIYYVHILLYMYCIHTV